MYRRLTAASTPHPGRRSVRELLDSFEVIGPDGCHRCLVHPPLWESVLTFLFRNPLRRLPAPVLAVVLRHLFLALDFLRTECKIIHTGALDIKSAHRSFVLLKSRGQISKLPTSCLASRTTQFSPPLKTKSYSTRQLASWWMATEPSTYPGSFRCQRNGAPRSSVILGRRCQGTWSI